MEEKILALMVGVPGSGKSTFLRKINFDKVVISRDTIRFSMLQDSEDYFAKEKYVFNEFCKQIRDAAAAGVCVVADATHLNNSSRAKTLKATAAAFDKIIAFYFDVPLEVALERNAKRTGREFVPESVIENMYNSLTIPSKDEGISTIFIVDESGKIDTNKTIYYNK